MLSTNSFGREACRCFLSPSIGLLEKTGLEGMPLLDDFVILGFTSFATPKLKAGSESTHNGTTPEIRNVNMSILRFGSFPFLGLKDRLTTLSWACGVGLAREEGRKRENERGEKREKEEKERKREEEGGDERERRGESEIDGGEGDRWCERHRPAARTSGEDGQRTAPIARLAAKRKPRTSGKALRGADAQQQRWRRISSGGRRDQQHERRTSSGMLAASDVKAADGGSRD
ncbi:hypothetical protein Scep_022557 [Stephania cephalantha]|uniref:Uncharacterized protein n=1 Tax=Stephania cephalantha TaxID=152367 RepID=A0AAP0FG11_9MAGN